MLASIQTRLGYSTRLAAALYIVVALLFVGFGSYALSRLEDGCKTGTGVPGNCPYFHLPRYRTGLIVHLALIVPASILVCFQFIPWIRRAKPTIHRWTGRVIAVLLLGSNAAALAIARWTFGGYLGSQLAIGLLAIATTVSTVLAIVAIRCTPRRIDSHRAWMIRTWAWIASIITQRILIGISLKIASGRGFAAVMTCAALAHELREHPDQLATRYPLCVDASDLYGTVYAVPATIGDNQEGVAATFLVVATPMLWLSFVIHAVLAETWLGYQRQVVAATARDLPVTTCLSSEDVKA